METNSMEMKPYEVCSFSVSLNGIVHVVLSQDSFETSQNGHLCLVALYPFRFAFLAVDE